MVSSNTEVHLVAKLGRGIYIVDRVFEGYPFLEATMDLRETKSLGKDSNCIQEQE